MSKPPLSPPSGAGATSPGASLSGTGLAETSLVEADGPVDRFASDRLPAPDLLPDFIFELPELQFPPRLNCAQALLDHWVATGHGQRLAVQGHGVRWTYAELQAQVNRIAQVLVGPMGLVTGNRVLLRGANSPMLAACWLAVVKAGGIAVGTMPLLRASELATIANKAQVSHALCDRRLAVELRAAQPRCTSLRELKFFGDADADAADASAGLALGDDVGLEALAAGMPAAFESVDTAATDVCLMAFTSGTTGVPKGTMHFHRDVMAACACWPVHVLRASADDVFIGSPPLAFTFGLGGLLAFPLALGASTVLVEKATPDALLAAIGHFKATVCFTAPTAYRAIATLLGDEAAPDIGSLRQCVSAGEPLPAATRALWREVSGIEIIDGIGSTELFHIFISAREDQAKAGATGFVVPGYRATVVDENGQPLPRGQVGRLAIKGPTGCKYLEDPRQASYVENGWNMTGDAYLVDEEGQFVYQARTDDMIISGGYNIAGPEVEDVLLQHPSVAECAVVGVSDEQRGMRVKAFVVLRDGHAGDTTLVKTLQDFVKQQIAPYKYPRELVFVPDLPRTETGKLQRFKLKAAAG